MHLDANTTQNYLFKLQGYLMKVRDSFESLPCNNAYRSLSSYFYKTGSIDGIYIHHVKSALHDVALIATRHADNIATHSGVAKKSWKSKLTDKERAIRIDGLYSHRPVEAFKFEKLSDGFESLVRSIFQEIKKENLSDFLDYCRHDLNSYLHDLYLGKPNRGDDLDKLNTLLKQIDAVLDNMNKLIEMVIDNPFDDPFAKDNLENAIHIFWKLQSSIIGAISSIKLSERQHKQLEIDFIKELALNYKHYLNLNPSADNRRGKFMEFVSLIEDEVDTITNISIRDKNRFGRVIVQKALKELNR